MNISDDEDCYQNCASFCPVQNTSRCPDAQQTKSQSSNSRIKDWIHKNKSIRDEREIHLRKHNTKILKTKYFSYNSIDSRGKGIQTRWLVGKDGIEIGSRNKSYARKSKKFDQDNHQISGYETSTGLNIDDCGFMNRCSKRIDKTGRQTRLGTGRSNAFLLLQRRLSYTSNKSRNKREVYETKSVDREETINVDKPKVTFCSRKIMSILPSPALSFNKRSFKRRENDTDDKNAKKSKIRRTYFTSSYADRETELHKIQTTKQNCISPDEATHSYFDFSKATRSLDTLDDFHTDKDIKTCRDDEASICSTKYEDAKSTDYIATTNNDLVDDFRASLTYPNSTFTFSTITDNILGPHISHLQSIQDGLVEMRSLMKSTYKNIELKSNDSFLTGVTLDKCEEMV